MKRTYFQRVQKDAKGSELRDLSVERVDGVDSPAHGSGFLILKSQAPGEGASGNDALKGLLSGLDIDTLDEATASAASTLAEGLGISLKGSGKKKDLEAKMEDEDSEEDGGKKKPKAPPFGKPMAKSDAEAGTVIEISETTHPDGSVTRTTKQLKSPGEQGSAPVHIPPHGSLGRGIGSGSGTATGSMEVDVTKFAEQIADAAAQKVMDALTPFMKSAFESMTGRTFEVQKSASAPKSKQAAAQDSAKSQSGDPVKKSLGSGVFTDVIFGQ